MVNVLPQWRPMLLSVGLCLAMLISADVLASPQANAIVETKVGQDQLIAILNVPMIQKELELSNEQVAQIAAIKQAPFAVTFSEAIAPLKSILTDKQLKEFKRTALPGLMVRAFLVAEVRDTLELTPEQMTSIAAIHAKLRTLLQHFKTRLIRVVRRRTMPKQCSWNATLQGFTRTLTWRH